MILAREAGLGLDLSTPCSQSFPHTHTPTSAPFSQLPPQCLLNSKPHPLLERSQPEELLNPLCSWHIKSLSSSSSNLAPNNFQPHLIAAPVILVIWLSGSQAAFSGGRLTDIFCVCIPTRCHCWLLGSPRSQPCAVSLGRLQTNRHTNRAAPYSGGGFKKKNTHIFLLHCLCWMLLLCI